MHKIGVYTPFPAYIGGGERYIMTLASALQKDFRVDFLSGDPQGYQKLKNILEIDMSNINFVRFDGYNSVKKFLVHKFNKSQISDYDAFVCASNHATPPSIGIGKKNILHVQFPYPHSLKEKFNIRGTINDKFAESTYKLAVVNSQFTKSHLQKQFSTTIEVINPPVEIEKFNYTSFENKKNQILSVGRFIGTEDNKRQLEMVRFFKKLCALHPHLNLEYLCIGGERPEPIHQEYLSQVRKEAAGYPIRILNDVSFQNLIDIYSESKIFWHGKGYGVDHVHPEFTEHFGISTVEAMASGCIPIVYQAGGQVEIVEDGYSGSLWKTEEQLIHKTVEVFKNTPHAAMMAHNAWSTSEKFSSARFRSEVSNFMAGVFA